MSKKKQKKLGTVKSVSPVISNKIFSFTDFRAQALLLIILGFVFYSNTFNNEYAFDDGIVIEKNQYVQNGFSGIGKITTRDAYDSFYRQLNAGQQFSGGRYRPLSIITFAIEQQFFGSKDKDKPENDLASLRHIVNVLLYICSVIALLYLLSNYIFKNNPLIAFIAALLFLIHPLHTEVVANIKSRDEIMSLLFIILTFIFVFRYDEQKKKSQLLYGCISYFLALLAKEYAVMMMIFIPMLLYIVKKKSFTASIASLMPYFGVLVVYFIIRYSSIGIGTTHENSDVLNNPFKFATIPQKWATRILILLFYLKLLFYPHPLSFDYSYNTIPYVNFGNGLVWLSIIAYSSMIATAIVLFFRRNILSFALAFYLLHLLLVSNFILDVGATMGERLAYHSSVGFVILIAVFITWLTGKISQPSVRTTTLIITGCLVTAWCGAKVIERNPEWKNDTVLYTTDVNKAPESALANGDAGMIYYNLAVKDENKAQEKQLLDKALNHLTKSVAIHKAYVNGYLNLAVVYMRLHEYEKAKENLDVAKTIFPNNPILQTNYKALASYYYNDAMKMGAKDPIQAVQLLEKAVEIAPGNEDYWYNLGGAAYTVKDFPTARNAWTKTLEINPANAQAKQGMAAIQGL